MVDHMLPTMQSREALALDPHGRLSASGDNTTRQAIPRKISEAGFDGGILLHSTNLHQAKCRYHLRAFSADVLRTRCSAGAIPKSAPREFCGSKLRTQKTLLGRRNQPIIGQLRFGDAGSALGNHARRAMQVKFVGLQRNNRNQAVPKFSRCRRYGSGPLE